jgi:hypothetical protein
MGDFIETGTLAGPMADAKPLPSSANPNLIPNLQAARWNEIRQALIDTRAHVSGWVNPFSFIPSQYHAGIEAGTSTVDVTGWVTEAIAAAMDKGKWVQFPAGKFRLDGTIALTNDAATPPKQRPLKIIGAGAHFSGRGTWINVGGGTILDMLGVGDYGKFVTNGLGLLELSGLTFTDSSIGTTPFLYTTNTTLLVHGCAFVGHWTRSGTACDQDAIVLGGTEAVEGFGNLDHGFQGYGTVIRENYFDYIRRAVHCRVYCNSITIDTNTVWTHAGSNLPGGAPIEVDGGAGFAYGNTISNNTLEVVNYEYGIKLTRGNRNLLINNGVWDNTGMTLAHVRIDPGSHANVIIPGASNEALLPVSDAGNYNIVMGPQGRGRFGLYHVPAEGNVLQLYPGLNANHTYMELFARSASPTIRSGLIGYAVAGGNGLTIENTLGQIALNPKTGSFISYKGQMIGSELVDSPPAGAVTLDGGAYRTAVYTLTAAGGTWALNVTGSVSSVYLTIMLINTSGGPVTVNFSSNVKLAGAWTSPASGYSRTLTLRRTGSVWLETSRTAADVPN